MMIHVPSNTYFSNRKQAIKCMGHYIYSRELAAHNFEFINENNKSMETIRIDMESVEQERKNNPQFYTEELNKITYEKQFGQ